MHCKIWKTMWQGSRSKVMKYSINFNVIQEVTKVHTLSVTRASDQMCSLHFSSQPQNILPQSSLHIILLNISFAITDPLSAPHKGSEKKIHCKAEFGYIALSLHQRICYCLPLLYSPHGAMHFQLNICITY